MMRASIIAALVLASCVIVILSWVVKYMKWMWLEPKKLERILRDQGFRGSPYKLLVGDLVDSNRLIREARSRPISLTQDIAPRVAPLLFRTMKSYGKMSLTWFGPIPRVNIMDPEMVREILSNKFGHFEKPRNNPMVELLATGLANYEGEKWAKHRRIINPAFHQEKLKLMLPAFSASCADLINRWKKLVDSSGDPCELDIWPELQNFTGDVISRTAFGSSFEEGRRIFHLQREQAKNIMEVINSIPIPGLRFLPTKRNLRMREIDKEVRKILNGIINNKIEVMQRGDVCNDDLLGILMESNFKLSEELNNSKNLALTIKEVIEECKLFYFAGQETTSVLLTWTIILLSVNQDWQSRARQEVFQVFGDGKPFFDGLNRLKIVTMILYEVLRLYPPVVFLVRRTYKEMKLGETTFPPGVQLCLPILFIHSDPEIWGEDASEFKPERFSEGIAKASRDRVAFFPFGWGPRICIGQSFALMEAKLALAMMLQNFSFELSPMYSHAPHNVVTIQPQHGAQVLLHRL
ncbi:Secologanin synthase [Acorus calamus]|uniref:Secologanin synthase n=1 Tax=Acorus calamus TaxID=4465 RepID=A0AAV9F5P6_ACOCL|nr:Secologanin synthase [Acorus calamus]